MPEIKKILSPIDFSETSETTLRYAIDLRSLTGGRGRFTITHDHYDVLPAHLVDRVRRDLPVEQAVVPERVRGQRRRDRVR